MGEGEVLFDLAPFALLDADTVQITLITVVWISLAYAISNYMLLFMYETLRDMAGWAVARWNRPAEPLPTA